MARAVLFDLDGVLVDSGPYRLSRNPIYLGFVGILIGMPLALGTYWGLILSPVLVLSLNQFVVQHEERYLREKFPVEYVAYASRVRRWL